MNESYIEFEGKNVIRKGDISTLKVGFPTLLQARNMLCGISYEENKRERIESYFGDIDGGRPKKIVHYKSNCPLSGRYHEALTGNFNTENVQIFPAESYVEVRDGEEIVQVELEDELEHVLYHHTSETFLAATDTKGLIKGSSEEFSGLVVPSYMKIHLLNGIGENREVDVYIGPYCEKLDSDLNSHVITCEEHEESPELYLDEDSLEIKIQFLGEEDWSDFLESPKRFDDLFGRMKRRHKRDL